MKHGFGRLSLGFGSPCTFGPGPARAQGTVENGVNRIGGDYNDFEMEPNVAGFAPCQSACTSDPSCRAWTYVVPGVQGLKPHCWLKNTVPTASKDKCCVSGITANEEFCEHYADAAVYDAQDAVSHHCGFSGPRWTTDKEAHRKWCLSLNGNQKPANDEQEARRTGTKNCVAGCSEYAFEAESAAVEARSLGCGITGPRWSESDDDHYVWCVQGNQGNAKAETAAREAELEKCRQAHQCVVIGPDEQAGGGLSNPKQKYECDNLGGGKKRCCLVTLP